MNTKEAIQKIRDIAKEQRLNLETDASLYFLERTKPLFTSVATDDSGNKVVFRFAFSELIRSINREVELYNKSEQFGIDFMPKRLSSVCCQEYAWLVYDYFHGVTCGNVYQFGSVTEFAYIEKAIIQLQVLTKSTLNPRLFHERSSHSWKNLLNAIFSKAPGLEEERIVQMTINRLIDMPIPKSDTFVHGDLHPQNIIFNGNELRIIDWEEAHFDSYAFDLSFLYIRSYNKEYRKNLIENVFSVNNNHIDFYYVLLLNLLRDYFEWHQIIANKNELMNIKETIGAMSSAEIIEDLREQIDTNYKKLNKMGV